MGPLDRKAILVTALLMGLVIVGWLWGLYLAPPDAFQGEVYRIIYLHVPAAAAAFSTAFVLLALAVWTLARPSHPLLHQQLATVEVGLLFTVLTLATGSIWGRPTWGVWWTWDARPTTTFLLALLFGGYMLLYHSSTRGRQRAKVCSVLGILIAADVPIIYKSVTWWRTLHQPPSIIREGGSTMAPEMRMALLFNVICAIALALWLVRQRARNIALAEQLEDQSFSHVAG